MHLTCKSYPCQEGLQLPEICFQPSASLPNTNGSVRLSLEQFQCLDDNAFAWDRLDNNFIWEDLPTGFGLPTDVNRFCLFTLLCWSDDHAEGSGVSRSAKSWLTREKRSKVFQQW
ncbi:hypothetical protein N7499_012089 [Penicillium canescens]|nr:hypothetical protein N7522_007607 [Penicillium canescens]KAJ6066015.1 hypothetical protein N7499_012089 [Penicillium canescens]KAJ6175339.1 hypothetical protein N7485_002253 [Penicillium canescens]